MKQKMIIGIASAVLIALTLSLFADQTIFDELKDKIETYRSANITPQMNSWKNTIDNELSSDDLDELNALRQKMADHRSERVNRRAEKAGPENRPDRDEIKAFRNEIRNGLILITDKYPDLVSQLQNEASGKFEEWHTDLRTIHQEWREDNAAELEQLRNDRQGKGKNGKWHKGGNAFCDSTGAGRGMRMGGKGSCNFDCSGIGGAMKNGYGFNADSCVAGERFVGRIFLYDGEENYESIMMGANEFDIKQENSTAPNPFTDNTKLTFTLDNPGNVIVTVMNTQGSKVETLYNGYLNSGDHEFTIDGSKFTAGTYIYKIETENGIKTGKMIKR